MSVVSPRLIMISDIARFGREETIQAARRLCQLAAQGEILVQLRDKQLNARARLRIAHKLREVTHEAGQWLSVNDRIDIALLAQADSIHLGEESVAASAVRRLLSPKERLWVTRAWHASEKIAPAGVDAFLLSPILRARKGSRAKGLTTLRSFCSVASSPVYALGGVSPITAPLCLASGATGVACIGAAYTAPESLIASLGIRRC